MMRREYRQRAVGLNGRPFSYFSHLQCVVLGLREDTANRAMYMYYWIFQDTI